MNSKNKYLKQRHYFQLREYELTENGVKITIKNLLNSESAVIPFENIPLESYERTEPSKLAVVLMVFVYVIGALTLLIDIIEDGAKSITLKFLVRYLLIFGIPFLIVHLSKTSHVTFGQDYRLPFYKNKPNKKAFEDFIVLMQETKKVFLRQKFLIVRPNINNPSDVQLLHWLKSMGALKQEEIEILAQDPPFDLKN